MSLTSLSFFVFFMVVFGGCLVLKRHNDRKKWFLLAASYYFYLSIDWRFSFSLVALTAINYLAGQVVATQATQAARRFGVTVAISLSLAILFYFKYANFFISQVAWLLNIGSIDREHLYLNVFMPVGISFITFQAITYPIDMYSGRVTHRASIVDFALFMAFFPRLLSGPIVRAADFLPQLENNQGFTGAHIMEGLFLVIRGLFKKIMIADVLALHVVDPAFASPHTFSSTFLLISLIAYSFQVYADLSGYTDIALGTGRMLGYRLPINFNRPYLATSIANYWQRWHISMSSFFRDYLYQAIASWTWCNIYGKLLIVFMAIGLWHGAGWNFILYGLIHGALVAFEHFRNSRRPVPGLPNSILRGTALLVRIVQIFLIVSITRVLFRVTDLDESFQYMHALLFSSATGIPLSGMAIFALSLATLFHFTPVAWRDTLGEWFVRSPAPVSAGLAAFIVYIFTAIASGSTAFIYFQF
jgi:D-alanyl-lipoteichoic acid acyltransferase DltB (MBOAT superfamily)